MEIAFTMKRLRYAILYGVALVISVALLTSFFSALGYAGTHIGAIIAMRYGETVLVAVLCSAFVFCSGVAWGYLVSYNVD